MPELYEMRIIADGEVRDKNGNLKESGPVQAVTVVTEEQAAQIMAALHQEATQ